MTVKELLTQVMREYKFPERDIEIRFASVDKKSQGFEETQVPPDKVEWCLEKAREKISELSEYQKDWLTFEELGRQVALEEGLPESLFDMLNEHANKETGASKMKIPPGVLDKCKQVAREQTRQFLAEHPWLNTKAAPNN